MRFIPSPFRTIRRFFHPFFGLAGGSLRVGLLMFAMICSPAGAEIIPGPRGVTVETDRYRAEIVDGALVGVLNKLTGEEYLRGEGALAPVIPHLPSGLGSQSGAGAMEAARKILTKPWMEFPADMALPNQRFPSPASRMEWKPSAEGGTLRYTGLTDGQNNFPAEVFELVIAVDGASGDLLLTPRAESPKPGVYGVNLTVAPTRHQISVEAPIFDGVRITEDMASTLWRNKWPDVWDYAFVALNGTEKGAVGIWAQDDKRRYKDLYFLPLPRSGGIALSLATMGVPPYEKADKLEGVTWRVQAFDADWRQAAARFRDWREKAGVFARRPDWAKEVSFVAGGVHAGKGYLDQLEAFFGPEHLDRTVTFAPVIRAANFDTRHWDNTPYKTFKDEMPAWKKSGAKLMAYLQPMIVWGVPKGDEANDPEVKRVLALHEEADTRSAFAEPPGSKLPYVDQHHLGHKEWQAWFLRWVNSYIQDDGADGIYHDQTYPAPIDSRGLINGMTPPQGMADYFYKAADANPDSIHGTEHMNEVNSVGASLGIASGILWGPAPNMRWQRIRHPSSVSNALHYPRGTLFAFPHYSDIFTRGEALNWHWGMDLQEGRGEIAGFPIQNGSLFNAKDTFDHWRNEAWLDRQRALLFVKYGLRPAFPENPDPGVISFFLGKKGEDFRYERTPWGTRFVQKDRGKEIVHYGRAHGVTHLPEAKGGGIAGWIFYNNDGPSGLRPESYYVVDPKIARPPVYFSPAFEMFPGAGITPSFYESGVVNGAANAFFAWLDISPIPSVGGVVKGDRIHLHSPEPPKMVWLNGKKVDFKPVQLGKETVYEIPIETPSRIVVLLKEPEAGFDASILKQAALLRSVSDLNRDVFEQSWETGRLKVAPMKFGENGPELSALQTSKKVFVGERNRQLFLPVRAPADQKGKLTVHFRDNSPGAAKAGSALAEWQVDGRDYGRHTGPLTLDFSAGQSRVILITCPREFSVGTEWTPEQP